MWGSRFKSIILTLLSIAALTAPIILQFNRHPLKFFDYFSLVLLTVWLFNEFYLPSTPKPDEVKERLSLQILSFFQPGAIFVTCLQYFWFGPTLHQSSVIRVLGLLLAISGMVIRSVSMKTLGNRYTMVVSIREGHEIVNKGVYKYVRHPGYLGQYLFLLGFVLFLPSTWGLCFYFFWCFAQVYRIQIEENILEQYLGIPYKIYKQKSKRLIPFIY